MAAASFAGFSIASQDMGDAANHNCPHGRNALVGGDPGQGPRDRKQ
ncbi:hypothetical protein ISM_08855 [Roseovarius nubinhibens ISM]|uniref:Uncharacterized protein n=1 Tax=Roseovarius nubinhibens (strain ATCC BAA-591 / DSM 15170 / ISM) TaxID=89187 RepID=A3SM13_ROSNI|nr:hypothetical protein ISM_08855 [Roseovarius nubinhibens ISM]